MQVAGTFAVVASLIFVGLEMRQAQEISMSQTYQSRTSAVAEWDSEFASNPAALSAQRKAARGDMDQVTDAEYDAYLYTVLGLFMMFDNAHYQYQQGFVSQEFWDSALASLKFQMSNPLARAIILERVERGVRPDFRDVVLGIDAELETASGK
ncbi:MAG: hypothetical protein PVJ33_01350 [Lysobacterales bacterium]